MPTQRDARRRANRQRILDAATELFFQEGYAGATLDAICQALQCTKPFVYWYFKDKTEIYDTVSLEAAEAIHLPFSAPAAADPDPAAELRASLAALMERHVRLFKAGSLYYRDPTPLSPATRDRIRGLARGFHHRLAGLIEAGMQARELRCGDARLTALAVGAIPGFMFTWYRPEGALAPEVIARRMTVLMLRTAGMEVADTL